MLIPVYVNQLTRINNCFMFNIIILHLLLMTGIAEKHSSQGLIVLVADPEEQSKCWAVWSIPKQVVTPSQGEDNISTLKRMLKILLTQSALISSSVSYDNIQSGATWKINPGDDIESIYLLEILVEYLRQLPVKYRLKPLVSLDPDREIRMNGGFLMDAGEPQISITELTVVSKKSWLDFSINIAHFGCLSLGVKEPDDWGSNPEKIWSHELPRILKSAATLKLAFYAPDVGIVAYHWYSEIDMQHEDISKILRDILSPH